MKFQRFFFLAFSSSFAFQGVGDCEKLLSDYAQLTNKSVFLPAMFSGHCVIQNEKHFPLVLKSAGYDYKLKDDVIQVLQIQKSVTQYSKPKFKPKDLYYDIVFYFVNLQSAIDCGLKMSDIVATAQNLDYSFTFDLALGCPAFAQDGTFGFRVNAHLLDTWSYSHGVETSREHSTITSASGAVTTQYEYITAGLNLTLEQNENGVFYTLKYTGKNGSVTSSHGAIVERVEAQIVDEYDKVRKIAFLPIGKETIHATYTLLLMISPRNE